MGFSIGERQRAAPRTAKDEPFIDPEFFAQSLDIGDQIPGRVSSSACGVDFPEPR
jgi:hypothetical protein